MDWKYPSASWEVSDLKINGSTDSISLWLVDQMFNWFHKYGMSIKYLIYSISKALVDPLSFDQMGSADLMHCLTADERVWLWRQLCCCKYLNKRTRVANTRKWEFRKGFKGSAIPTFFLRSIRRQLIVKKYELVSLTWIRLVLALLSGYFLA